MVNVVEERNTDSIPQIPVSVIMPVYNAEEYLKESIESILNQTFDNFEFLIIDDGSKDGSLNIIKWYAEQDKRIRWKSRGNRGLSATLNELLKMASGKYIARMDADDISRPYRLARQYKYMEAHTELTVLGSPVKIMGTGEIKMNQHFDTDEVRGIRMMFRNAGVAHPTAMIRKAFLDEKRIRYDENNLGSEDYQLWSDVICNEGKISASDKSLLDYRVVPGSMSDAHKRDAQQGIYKAKKQLLGRFGYFCDEEIECMQHFYEIDYNLDVECLYKAMYKIFDYNNNISLYSRKILKAELALQWFWYGCLRIKHGRDYRMMKLKYIKNMGIIGSIPYILRNVKPGKR